MAITDELRKWAMDNTVRGEVLTTLPAQHPVHGTVESLLRIADRIDAEHERQLEVLYHDMSDAEYVKLPVDADGEPIHQGELVEYRDHSGAWHEETTVAAITDVGCYVWAGAHLVHVWGNDCRHHHAPTVEDVLTEFGIDWEHEDNCEDRAVLLAEYAAKLTLASNEE